MGTCILTVKSLTYAMKGEALLRAAGIPCKVLRISPERTKNGCGFGLSLACQNAVAAEHLLRRSGVPVGQRLT